MACPSINFSSDQVTTKSTITFPRSRPSSMSAIPRPVSGTSRRTSSRLVHATNQKPIVKRQMNEDLSCNINNQSLQSKRESLHSDNAATPTLYPRSMLPRSDSMVPFKDRPEGDLSGVQEQLQPNTNLSKRSVSKDKQLKHIPKSYASKITPRSLIKPIHPSIPRSSTTGQLACFPRVQDISPMKPAKRGSIQPATSYGSDDKLDVVDALLESRMTRHEIEALDQVRSEVCDNQKRQSISTNLSYARDTCEKQSLAANADRNQGSPIALRLSVNDEVNPQRLERQRRNDVTGRRLFVNTALANTLMTHESSPLSYSTPDSSSTSLTSSSVEDTLDLRNVLSAKNNAYWTGRYVAARDRIRKCDCDELLKPQGPDRRVININSTEFEEKFDALDCNRMDRVLHELKGYCKTEAALASFKAFEIGVKKNPVRNLQPFVKSDKGGFAGQNGDKGHPSTDCVGLAKGMNQGSRHHCSGQVSRIDAQSPIAKPSSVDTKPTKLIKSNTMNNLSIATVVSRHSTPLLPRITSKKPLDELGVQSPSTGPNLTTSNYSLETHNASSNASTQHRCEQMNNATSSRSNTDENAGNVNKFSNFRRIPSSYSWSLARSKNDEKSDALMNRATERPVDSWSASNLKGFVSGSKYDEIPSLLSGQVIRETAATSRRNKHHQPSGPKNSDLVKKVVGAGIREVRRMGRRVGSMGWANSAEDLKTDVTAKL